MKSNDSFSVAYSLCLAAALAFVASIFLTSCTRPAPDYARVRRGQFGRVLEVDGRHCFAWLPLVVRGDLVPETLEASRPWGDALGFTVVVPAQTDDVASLEVSVQACPQQYLHSGRCARLAETHTYCDGPDIKHVVRMFVVGDAVQDYYVLMHELGHALGVDSGGDKHGHSPHEWSIMYPSISASLMDDSDDITGERPAQWVRPADAEALREAWGLR